MSTTKRRRDEDVSDAPLTLREAETSLRGAALSFASTYVHYSRVAAGWFAVGGAGAVS